MTEAPEVQRRAGDRSDGSVAREPGEEKPPAKAVSRKTEDAQAAEASPQASRCAQDCQEIARRQPRSGSPAMHEYGVREVEKLLVCRAARFAR